ncbi:hypothetical protein ACEQ8H_008236 [Pleosporales sp. CAS-2024a]
MSSKPRIPPWKSAAAEEPVTTLSKATQESEPTEQPQISTSPTADAPTPTESDLEDLKSTDLLDQARRFLDDAAIRDAPREKKAAFLESKGVRADDIEILLGPESHKMSSAQSEVGERVWSTTPLTSVQVSQISPQPVAQPRDIPPIVTYPEFLAQTEKPPPLITTQRLLNTAYVTGGLMATMYGLSKYIVAPMTRNLTEVRHDFASHTQQQLAEFNKRLGESVTVDPATKVKSKSTDMADDVSEADSDPTELYHRDYGTQTTPQLSRRPSVTANDLEPTVTAHENRLKIIKSHLQELEATQSNDMTSASSLKTKVSDLTTYLNEMSYQHQYYSNMNGFYGSNYGMKDGKNDQIEVLKNDIRAVKGVFLSARNFPTGGRNTSPMPIGRIGS